MPAEAHRLRMRRYECGQRAYRAAAMRSGRVLRLLPTGKPAYYLVFWNH